MITDELLSLAREAAASAAEVIEQYYQGDFAIRIKPDSSPVTEADEAAETIIRQMIVQRFPSHGIYGEEYGRERENADVLWLIDPIDGTKSFVRGYPMFSTQIAARVDGELMVGVSSAPWCGELVWGVRGGGAFKQGDQSLSVSQTSDFSQAILSTGNLESMAASSRWQRLGELIPRLHRTRGYGDFYHYHLLAGGHIDAVVESDVNILDIAALSVIVEAAGGRFTDLDGQPVGLETRSVLATNGLLHEPLLEALGDG